MVWTHKTNTFKYNNKRTEATEQIAVIQYCDYNNIKIFAIANGGSRHILEAVNLKKQGVKAGVPDLFIPIPNNEFHGLFIEMKYGKNKPTEAQKEWLAYLNSVKYKSIVCYSTNEAINTINDYLKR